MSSQNALLTSLTIDNRPQPLTKIKASEASDAILNKHSVEPISIRFLNLFHRDANNLPLIPPSSTPAPYENINQFESLNLHHIFGWRHFRNQKRLTAATNESLVTSGLILSTIGSLDTIANPPKGNPIKKRRRILDKLHMDIVFGDCVALGGHRYALLLFYVATR